MTSLVLTLLADDAHDALSLSHLFAAHNVQWHETQVSRINGQITGMAMISAAEADADRLVSELRALPGVQVAVAPTRTPTGEVPRTLQMHVLGPDRPSLASELLGSLDEIGLQVRELRTHHHQVEQDEVFGATMLLAVPPDLTGDVVAAATRAAGQLGLDAEADTIYEGTP